MPSTTIGYVPILSGGRWSLNGVDLGPSKGADGIPPLLRINTATQHWQISIDSGASWTDMNVVAAGHSPYIDTTTGTWWTWDPSTETFLDTGVLAGGADKSLSNLTASGESHFSKFDGAYSSLTGTPTLGTAAAAAVGDFASAAQGTKADAAYEKPVGGIPKSDLAAVVQDDLAKRNMPMLTFAPNDFFTEIYGKIVQYGVQDNENMWFCAAGTNLGLDSATYLINARRGSATILVFIAYHMGNGNQFVTGDYTSVTEKPVWKQVSVQSRKQWFDIATTAQRYIKLGTFVNAALCNISGHLTSDSEYDSTQFFDFGFRVRGNLPVPLTTAQPTVFASGLTNTAIKVVTDKLTGDIYIGPFSNYCKVRLEITAQSQGVNNTFTPVLINASVVDALTDVFSAALDRLIMNRDDLVFATLNSHINKAQLKAIVATATDWADFKTRVEAL